MTGGGGGEYNSFFHFIQRTVIIWGLQVFLLIKGLKNMQKIMELLFDDKRVI